MEATLTSSLGRTTLSSSTLSIGRASDNLLVIDDAQASAYHAEIKPSPDGAVYLVTDQNSTHGTFVNEERLPIHTPHALNAGDIIRIGSLHFTYELTSMTNPSELAITGSSSYEPTVAATPNAISSAIPDERQAQAPQPLPTSTNSGQSGQPYAQAGYSISPSGSLPVASQLAGPQRLKPRVGMWITLALVAVAIIGGSVLGILYNINRSTPTKTLQTFCSDYKNSNAQGVYDLLSSHTQAQTSVGVLNAILELVKSSGGVHDCTVSNVQENGSTATGHLTITLNNAQPNQSMLEHLTNEGGTWKMEEIAIQSPSY